MATWLRRLGSWGRSPVVPRMTPAKKACTVLLASALVVVLVVVVRDHSAQPLSAQPTPLSAAAPGPPPVTAPPAPVCGDSLLLTGPSKPPKGAVTVKAGNDVNVIGQTWLVKANTTYWFAPGCTPWDRGSTAKSTRRTGTPSLVRLVQ